MPSDQINSYKELRELGLEPAGFAVMHQDEKADYYVFPDEQSAVSAQARIIDHIAQAMTGEPEPPLEGLYLGSDVARIVDELRDNKEATKERLMKERETDRAEISRAWGLNNSLTTQVAMISGANEQLRTELAELRGSIEALEEKLRTTEGKLEGARELLQAGKRHDDQSVRNTALADAAYVCTKRMEERFHEFGTREHDTNACYYTGQHADLYDSLDEEDEHIANGIRAKMQNPDIAAREALRESLGVVDESKMTT